MGSNTCGDGPADPRATYGVQEIRQDVLNNVLEMRGKGSAWQALESAIAVANQSQLPAVMPNGTWQTIFSAPINAGLLNKLNRVLRVRVWFKWVNMGDAGAAISVSLNYGSMVIAVIQPDDFPGAGTALNNPAYVEFTLIVTAVPTTSTVNLFAAGIFSIVMDDVSNAEAAKTYMRNGGLNNVSTTGASSLAVTFKASSADINVVQGMLAMIEVVN